MYICILDGKEITNRETLHNILSDKLEFPDWYGRNLDALYDCLTDFHEEAEIRLLHEEELKEHLGNYAFLLSKVIRKAAENNPRIRWMVE